jgi:muramoyltetrapeptide carboxypeptidase LdcA involved in peptidoglycan recycling
MHCKDFTAFSKQLLSHCNNSLKTAHGQRAAAAPPPHRIWKKQKTSRIFSSLRHASCQETEESYEETRSQNKNVTKVNLNECFRNLLIEFNF